MRFGPKDAPAGVADQQAWADAANRALDDGKDNAAAIEIANAAVKPAIGDPINNDNRLEALDDVFVRKGTMMLAAKSFNPETREAECVISTGAKVRRRDWDGEFDEVLDMSPKAVRLDRLNAGAPLLDSHNYYSGLEAMLGGIVPGSARIENKELIARVKFSRGSELAQRVVKDMQDGMHFPLSAGYRIYKFTEDKTTTPMTRTAIDWQPLEVSLVTIPAEESGTGFRSAQGEITRRDSADGAATKEASIMQKPLRKIGESDADFNVRILEYFRKQEPVKDETDTALAKRASDYLAMIKTGEAEAEAEKAAQKQRDEEVRAALSRVEDRRTRGQTEEQTPATMGGIFKEFLAIGRQAGMSMEEVEKLALGPKGETISVDGFRQRAFEFLVKKQIDGGGPRHSSHQGGQEGGEGNGEYRVNGEDPKIGRNAAMTEALTVRLLSARRTPAIMNAEQREWCAAREITDRVGLSMRIFDGKEKPQNPQTRNFMQHTIVEMAAECIGYKFRNVLRPADAIDVIARAWHTTSDFPGIFENALNKSLLARYLVAMPTYREISAERTFNDFRPHPQVRAGDFPQPQPLQETGELRYGTAGESKESVSVKPYGVVFAISRQMMVNDDLGAIDQILGSTGQGILRFENTTFFNMFLSGASSVGPTLLQDSLPVFAAGAITVPPAAAVGHNNYADTHANGADPPNVVTLAAGRAALRGMRSLDGQFLNIPPRILLTGAANETAADQIVSSITPNLATSVNPFAGKLRTVTEPQITTTNWYLFTDPQSLPSFVYGFLAGAGGPRVRTDEPFGVQGVRVSLEHDFGCGAIDYRGAYRNTGLTS